MLRSSLVTQSSNSSRTVVRIYSAHNPTAFYKPERLGVWNGCQGEQPWEFEVDQGGVFPLVPKPHEHVTAKDVR
jgi:hypothetical protein